MDMDVKERQLIESAPFTAHIPTHISQATPLWAAAPVRRIVPAPAVEVRLRKQRTRAALARTALLLFDAATINLAFIAAYFVRYGLLSGVRFTTAFVREPFDTFSELEGVFTLGILAVLSLKGFYRLRIAGTWFRQCGMLISATTTTFAVYFAYDYVTRKTDVALDGRSRSLLVFAWVSILVLFSLERLLAAGALGLLYRHGTGLTNLLVVGSGRPGKLMMQLIAASPHLGYRLVGFLHDQDGPPTDFGRFRALGKVRDLDRVIANYRVAEVIIALPSHQQPRILHTMRHCERAGTDFRLVPQLYELSLSRIDINTIQGIPLIGPRRSLTNALEYRIKHLIDRVGALALLVLTAPVWLLTALTIALDSPGPVLLRQPRIGKHGQPFLCLKFRSMRPG
ncbi:MAG: sugar transferase, partial [Ktedonobacterales bacterium]|nr:sugar transferase [Ktedonobacterales bacterium]